MSPAEKAVLAACAEATVRTGIRGAAMSYEDASRIAEAELARREKHEPEGYHLITASEKAILVAVAAIKDPYNPTLLEQEFVWAAEAARREGA